MVRHKEGVELRSLKRGDQLADAGEIEVGVRPCAGIAPRAGMDGDRPHEGAEVELAHRIHDVSSKRPRAIGSVSGISRGGDWQMPLGSQSRLIHRRQCTAELMPDRRVSP